jgi:hypothetical protein
MARLRQGVIVAFAGLLLLSACAPSGDGETGATTPADSPTPDVSESPATPTPAERVLPGCEDLFPESTEAALAAEGLEPMGDVSAPGQGGYGASDPSLQALIEAGENVSCTWALPGSERGLSTSVTTLSATDAETVAAELLATGFSRSTASGDLYSMETGGEFPLTEAHALYEDSWVSTVDSFGTSAASYTEDALDTVISLNP